MLRFVVFHSHVVYLSKCGNFTNNIWIVVVVVVVVVLTVAFVYYLKNVIKIVLNLTTTNVLHHMQKLYFVLVHTYAYTHTRTHTHQRYDLDFVPKQIQKKKIDFGV